MKNLMTEGREFVRRIYDLKGSSYGRSSLHDREEAERNPHRVLKDLDIVKL